MGKSPEGAKVEEIAAALHLALKSQGFKKRGRTFNRITDEGLTQVINLQMGRFDPPGTYHVSGIRPKLYGSFTVNLGVYVPEVGRLVGAHGETKGFVPEFDCCVRERLAQAGGQNDTWWRNDERVIPDVLSRLQCDGLPFLDRFASRDELLRELARATSPRWAAKPARIISAIIEAGRGEMSVAKRLLDQQAREHAHTPHVGHVRGLAARLGVTLADDIV